LALVERDIPQGSYLSFVFVGRDHKRSSFTERVKFAETSFPRLRSCPSVESSRNFFLFDRSGNRDVVLFMSFLRRGLPFYFVSPPSAQISPVRTSPFFAVFFDALLRIDHDAVFSVPVLGKVPCIPIRPMGLWPF